MGFQPGHKLAKGGKREGSGRKKKSELEAKKAGAELVRQILDANAANLGKRYIARSLGKNGDRVLVHAIDKLLPDEKHESQPSTINIQFVRFDNTVQVQAAGLPATLLADHANGKEAGSSGMAPAGGQGQNGIKFHDF